MRAATLVFFSFISHAAASTAGREFQLIFLENIVETPEDGPLEVHVVNMGTQTASVTVSSPRTTCPSATAVVGPNQSRKFDVCWWMRLIALDYWPSFKTVLVQSSQDIMAYRSGVYTMCFLPDTSRTGPSICPYTEGLRVWATLCVFTTYFVARPTFIERHRSNPQMLQVYAYNKELYSADGYYALPTSELAYAYYISAYDEANIATQFAVSATVDGTVLQVELPTTGLPVEVNYKGLRYTNGQKYTVTMAQYETYLAQSRGDLTGAKIVANRPIAVFSGNVRNKDSSGSRDHLVAQLHPTGDWGTTFALQPVPRTQNFGDIVRVVARRIQTRFTITLAGAPSSDTITLNSPGDFYEFVLQTPALIQALNSDREIQVMQMIRSQSGPRIPDVADPAMIQQVPRQQWLTEYRSPALTYSRDRLPYTVNMAFIAVTSGQEGSILINGVSFNSIWTTVGGVAMTWTPVSGDSNSYTSFNNQPFIVVVYGASDRESYGFALGADLSNSKCQESLMTRGDGLDNDCDNRIDEEACNSVDDDADGLIDEDCELASTEAFGNSYVIMFMENNVDDNSNAESFLEVYLSAVDSTATVNYNVTTQFGNFSRTILPGQLDIFTDLPVNLRHIGSGIDTKAIIIMADGDVIVYGLNKQTWSTDGFLAFPSDVVGEEYLTAHYWPGTDLNEFAVTPVINDGTPTIVTVTMPENVDVGGTISSNAQFGGRTIGSGQTYSFEINYGQTAQFQAVSQNDNLNGARIVSSKPISAFSGNVRARVVPAEQNSRDHLVQQLAPVDTWGTQFITMPIPRTADRGDVFTVTAAFPGTLVAVTIYNVDGTSQPMPTLSLSAGQYAEFEVGSTQYAQVQSTSPVQLFQFVKTTADRITDNADPAMMLIPPVEAWSRNYQLQTPRTGQASGNGTYEPFENYLMIAIANDQRDGLRLGDAALDASWVVLGGTGFAATVVQVSNGRNSLVHMDPDVYFEALMYGRFDRESYALPLGLRLEARVCQPTPMIEGDALDNDCDGSVDEELCNSIDDDADGQIDEDCGEGLTSGTNFFVTYMENTVEFPKDIDLELYVASVGTTRTQVNVLVPLVNFPVYNTNSEIQPGEVQGYGFSYRLKNEGQGITGKTIYVRTSSDVVVYGVNKEKFSNDGFLVYPESSLGSDYYCVCWSPSTLNTEFAVVSTTSGTTVTITLPSNRADLGVVANGQTYISGQSFQITLDRFEVYQGQSVGDLTGTRIQATNRVAVFSGNVRTLVELSASRDHLVQQMIPTASYGAEFMVVPFPDRTVGDVLKVIARNSNTQVRVDGTLVGTVTSAGGFFEYQLSSSNPAVVTATGPVMVAQFVKSQDGKNNPEEADPSMFLVPATSNFVNIATFITPVYSGGRVAGADYINYLTLVIPSGSQGQVRLDSDTLNVNWVNIGTSNYVTATVNVPSGRSHRVTTTNGASFYGRLYGRADRESYAFPVGWSF